MAGTRTALQESARGGRGTRPSARRRFLAVSGAALAGAGRLAAAASAPATAGAAGGREAAAIRIAKQPGLGYLPLLVMRERRLLERRAPGVAVEWVEQTDNRTGPIGEALVAGTLHVGAGGPAVFFQGWDRGFAWKTTGALCTMPLYLVANRPELRTLKDFGPGDTIALPAPGGNQHVFLQMAAAQELGDAHALDHLVVGMSHADAQAALLAGRVAAHFGSPPFQYDELAQGGPDFGVVVDTYTVMGGPHTFTMTWAMEDWATGNPGLFAAFVAALQEATAFIGDDPAAAARLYVEGEPSRLSPDEIQRQLRGEGIAFTTTPRGFLPYAAFLRQLGAVEQVPATWEAYAFPHLHGPHGS